MKTSLKLAAIVAAFCASLTIAGCAGASNSSGNTQTPTPAVVITVSSIAPTTVVAGSAAVNLTVNGTGFTNTTSVQVSGVVEPTTFVSATQLTAAIPASQLSGGAILGVVAANGTSSSASGTAVNLEVDNPAPVIAQLTPFTLTTGSPSTTVAITGTGFVPGTIIQVNTTARSTVFVSSTQLNITLAAADLAAAGSLSLIAINPSPQGGTSAAVSIPINNPVPGALTLNPATAIAGTATPVTVTVTGSAFSSASAVQVGTTPRTTLFVSSTQLTFQLTVADQVSAAKLAVTIVNPAPGGGASSAATLTVLVPTLTPMITSVSPTSFVAGSGASSMYVFGTNLASTSVVQWNGINLTTSYTSGYPNAQLFAQVPAALTASVGTAFVTVNSPSASMPLSNGLSIAINAPPVPTITALSPNYGPIDTATPITITGSGFTTAATVAYNGTTLPSTYVNYATLTVTLPASSIALPGNGSFTVTVPAPGGGTSAAQVFSAYIPLVSNSMIYNPVNGLLYASIPGSVGAPMGNSIVSINPATGVFGTPIYVGSEPNKLALTADGLFLWVGLDGASAVRKVDLTANTAGLQFSLNGAAVYYYSTPTTALALAALPGANNSVVVASSSGSLPAIYDSGVARSNISGANSITAYALQVDGTRDEIYAGGSSLYTYTYSATAGLTLKASNTAISLATSTADDMQLVSGRLYNDTGKVYDAEAGTLLGTLYQSGIISAPGATFVDTTLGRIFVVDNNTGYSSYGYNQIQVFNSSDYTSLGAVIPVNVPAYFSLPSFNYVTPTRLIRWGANGLAFHLPFGIYSLQSNSVKDLSSLSADLAVTLATTGTATGSNTTFTATVTNVGPATATDVLLAAQAPATGSLLSATSASGTCGIVGGIRCSLGSLASGASATVTITVLQTVSGTSTLNARVSGSTNDPVSSNNTASASVTVTGSAYNLVPAIGSISPATILAGSSDTVITLIGAGFNSTSTVSLGGSILASSYSSATQLTATVPAAKLVSLGWAPITVSNSAPGGGTSSSFPLSIYSVVTLSANRMLYDPFSRKIMASVASTATTVTGNSIVAITPETSTVGTPVSIGSQPTNLALTDDGQILYTLLSGSSTIARYNMLTATADSGYTLPTLTPVYYYSSIPTDIAALPGTETVIDIDFGTYTGNLLADFNTATKIVAYRGTPTGSYTGDCPQFLNSTSLYAYSSSAVYGLRSFAASTGGLTVTSAAPSTPFSCFKIDGGYAYSSSGAVANLSSVPTARISTLPGISASSSSLSQALSPDTSLRRAFYPAASSTSSSAIDSIAAFDLNSSLLSSTIPLNMTVTEGSGTYTQVDVVRWGQDGLAVLTSGGHIYLVRGAAVVPQLLSTNTAATLTASSTSSIGHGTGNTTLTLTGSNFIPGVAVTWNGGYRTTTILDATHITVAIPASDLALAGSGSLVATNPGAPPSTALTVTIF